MGCQKVETESSYGADPPNIIINAEEISNRKLFATTMTFELEISFISSVSRQFIPGSDYYQTCIDCIEEYEFYLNGPLPAKRKAVKSNCVPTWA